jgi:hypothetical protein
VRYTSKRRRSFSNYVPLGPTKVAKRLNESPGPLAYDGPDAVVCPECEVGLRPKEDEPAAVPVHARFGWRAGSGAGPNSGRSPCRGGLPVVSDQESLSIYTEAEARHLRLVTVTMVKARYGLTGYYFNQAKGRASFPEAAARLEAPAGRQGRGPDLFAAEAVVTWAEKAGLMRKKGGEGR